jgi:hypothetical protein
MSQFDSGRNRFAAGIGSVGSYQVSGVPWITGSGANGLAVGAEDKITFPSVAKSVMVQLHDSNSDVIHVHFNSSGSNGGVWEGNHFFPLTTDESSITFNVKCKEIWVSNPPTGNGGSGSPSGYRVVAELTGISPNEMFILTGSGLTTTDGS